MQKLSAPVFFLVVGGEAGQTGGCLNCAKSRCSPAATACFGDLVSQLSRGRGQRGTGQATWPRSKRVRCRVCGCNASAPKQTRESCSDGWGITAPSLLSCFHFYLFVSQLVNTSRLVPQSPTFRPGLTLQGCWCSQKPLPVAKDHPKERPRSFPMGFLTLAHP